MLNFLRNCLSLNILVTRVFIYGIPYHLLKLYILKHFKTNYKKYDEALLKLGNRLTQFLEISGPSFIKLGQLLSTRPDLIGDIIAQALSRLRDQLPPFEYKQAVKIIESQLQKKIADVYLEIEKKPVAAASIAQVHKAKTLSGDIVAIKILRPSIEKKFANDLSLFTFLSGCLEVLFKKYAHRLKPGDIIETLKSSVILELDLRYEAAAADQIKQNTLKDEGIRIPKVFWELTAQRILTMEWIDGIPIDDNDALIALGFDLHAIAKKLAVTFFNQAYRDGFFHADLHPGNIFVDTDGNIVMVDFGIIGILEKSDRVYIAEIIYGFINRDYDRVSEIHFDAGYIPSNQNARLFSLACRSIGEPIVGLPVNKISIAKLLKQLFSVTRHFQMQAQPRLLLLHKTMMTIEGVGYSIYPEVNMWQLAEPWVKSWAKENFGAQAKMKEIFKTGKKVSYLIPSYLENINNLLVKLNNSYDHNELSLNKASVPKHKTSKIYYGYIIAFLSGIVIATTIFIYFK